MEEYSLGTCPPWVLCTHSVLLLSNGSYCCRQQDFHALGGLGGLKGWKNELSILTQTSMGSCISNLFISWHCLLKSWTMYVDVCWAYTAVESGEFPQLWSMESCLFFDVDYLSALFLSTITGGLVWSSRSSSPAVALIISDSHKLIALPYT